MSTLNLSVFSASNCLGAGSLGRWGCWRRERRDKVHSSFPLAHSMVRKSYSALSCSLYASCYGLLEKCLQLPSDLCPSKTTIQTQYNTHTTSRPCKLQSGPRNKAPGLWRPWLPSQQDGSPGDLVESRVTQSHRE